MNNETINIYSQETFKTFNDQLNFELSYKNYQKILLLIKQDDLNFIYRNFNFYIISNYKSNKNKNLLCIQMILSYYSDIYLKTNIQNYEFCLESIKQNGLTLQYVSDDIKDVYYDINLEAVKNNRWSLEFISEKYIKQLNKFNNNF